MSLARQHKALHEALRLAASNPVVEDGLAPAGTVLIVTGGDDPLALARLQHDLRVLHDMQSMERRVDAKRVMLPEYDIYIDAALAAAEQTGNLPQGDVIPTIMVWRIDVGEYERALDLADHILRHDIALPARFKRTAPTLVTEMIADAALEQLGKNNGFKFAVLERVHTLTEHEDMPDEVRAKLFKASGLELLRRAEAAKDGSGAAGLDRAATIEGTCHLIRARELDARCGVATRIKSLEAAERKRIAEEEKRAAQSGAGEQTAPSSSDTPAGGETPPVPDANAGGAPPPNEG